MHFIRKKVRATVTVRKQVLAKAERQVRHGRAKSVSAWVDAAMEEKARREDLAALLAEMKAENGPATKKEQEWARDVLGL
jgi:Arc/MetJ-type ribon-helix-helix transcriptional regulator